MANELERAEKSNQQGAAGGKALPISVRNARLDARDIQLGEILAVDEIRLMANTITIKNGGVVKIEALDATLILTEAAFNHFLKENVEEPLSGLEAAFLSGKIRLTGRYRMLLPIPFTILAVPEIENSARIRVASEHISVVGASIPGFGVDMIGEKINTQLSKAFDATKLPIPIQLTKITVETGRMRLEATTSIEITPKE